MSREPVRLQKVIAAAGAASRREAERLIRDGLVTVNGKVVMDVGTKVDPEACHIKVRGRLLRPETRKVYLLLNKPAGYVTTRQDPQGRPTVMELLRGVRHRVFPVGRLDYDSEGLLLLTNDGDLAHAVMHPRYHLPKTYEVKVKGKPSEAKLRRLARGIRLSDGRTAPATISKVRYLAANTVLEITLHQGRRRQIRRMFETVGHPVLRLRRIRIGPLRIRGLAPGRFRPLETAEIKALKNWLANKEGSMIK